MIERRSRVSQTVTVDCCFVTSKGQNYSERSFIPWRKLLRVPFWRENSIGRKEGFRRAGTQDQVPAARYRVIMGHAIYTKSLGGKI